MLWNSTHPGQLHLPHIHSVPVKARGRKPQRPGCFHVRTKEHLWLLIPTNKAPSKTTS